MESDSSDFNAAAVETRHVYEFCELYSTKLNK